MKSRLDAMPLFLLDNLLSAVHLTFFLQDVSPACLFCTARLLILRNSPTCTFIWACTSIWYTRVLQFGTKYFTECP